MVNAITTLATVAIATLSAAAPLSTRAPTCVSGLYIIVARGSTEAPGEGEPGKVADMIVARVPHSTSVAVDYPATLENYNASVAAGVADATQKVKDYVSACGSNSRIALLGYSQGGEVMTNMLSGPGQIDSSYMKYSKSSSSLTKQNTALQEEKMEKTIQSNPSPPLQSRASQSSATQPSPPPSPSTPAAPPPPAASRAQEVAWLPWTPTPRSCAATAPPTTTSAPRAPA